MAPNTLLEQEVRALGYQHVAGVDEAGRGPLAGPVVAAACVIPEGLLIPGVDDSKVLNPKQRYAVFQYVCSLQEVDWAVGVVDALLIDQINILQATFQAMLIAIDQLKKKPDFVLVDGSLLPKTDIPARAIVKGDALSQSIGLASIIAKQTRDDLMDTYDVKWPQYGFKEHKGYGTKKHLEALKTYGLSPIHRKTFKPCNTL